MLLWVQRHQKQLGALLSVALNVFLIVLKLLVGFSTASVAILATAIDSLIDLGASIMAYVAVHLSDAPPDEDHPFGHGKFEDFAGLIEAVLIMVGAFWIAWEAIPRLMDPKATVLDPVPGMIVMAIALVLDFVVSQILFRIAKTTESPALYADAHHLSTDVWSALAVIIGLGLVKLTGNPIFDPLVALVVAGLILAVGFQIVRTVFKHLVDTALPPVEADQIREIIYAAMPEGEPVLVEALRTRRSGSHRLIIFNLRVNPQWTVEKAHTHCDAIEAALEAAFPNSLVNIHIEPYLTQSAKPPQSVA